MFWDILVYTHQFGVVLDFLGHGLVTRLHQITCAYLSAHPNYTTTPDKSKADLSVHLAFALFTTTLQMKLLDEATEGKIILVLFASANMLFDASIKDHLPTEDVAVIGGFVASMLIKNKPEWHDNL